MDDSELSGSVQPLVGCYNPAASWETWALDDDKSWDPTILNTTGGFSYMLRSKKHNCVMNCHNVNSYSEDQYTHFALRCGRGTASTECWCIRAPWNKDTDVGQLMISPPPVVPACLENLENAQQDLRVCDQGGAAVFAVGKAPPWLQSVNKIMESPSFAFAMRAPIQAAVSGRSRSVARGRGRAAARGREDQNKGRTGFAVAAGNATSLARNMGVCGQLENHVACPDRWPANKGKTWGFLQRMDVGKADFTVTMTFRLRLTNHTSAAIFFNHDHGVGMDPFFTEKLGKREGDWAEAKRYEGSVEANKWQCLVLERKDGVVGGYVNGNPVFVRPLNLSVSFVELRPGKNQVFVQDFFVTPSALGLRKCKTAVWKEDKRSSSQRGNSTGRKDGVVVDHDDGGGWIKILEYRDAAYVPTVNGSGRLSVGFSPDSFAKLPDERIKELTKSAYYMRISSGLPNAGSVYLDLNVSYNDVGKAMGFAGHSYGLCVAEAFGACKGTWKTGKHCGERFDTMCGVTGDDCSRWVADYSGGGASCGLGLHKGKRCFSTGQGCRSRLRRNVTVWVKPRYSPPSADASEPPSATQKVS